MIGLAYVDTNRSYSFGTASLTNKDISGPTGVLWVQQDVLTRFEQEMQP